MKMKIIDFLFPIDKNIHMNTIVSTIEIVMHRHKMIISAKFMSIFHPWRIIKMKIHRSFQDMTFSIRLG